MKDYLKNTTHVLVTHELKMELLTIHEFKTRVEMYIDNGVEPSSKYTINAVVHPDNTCENITQSQSKRIIDTLSDIEYTITITKNPIRPIRYTATFLSIVHDKPREINVPEGYLKVIVDDIERQLNE